MRNALLVLCCVCVASLVGLALFALRTPAPRDVPPAIVADGAAQSERVAALEREIAGLRAEIGALRDRPSDPVRSNATVEPRATLAPASLDRDPAWYLREYERSFEGKPDGSALFRLAVEAYVVELASDLARRLSDGSALPAFRAELARIAGDRRLAGHAAVADALFTALSDSGSDVLALAALESLAIVGGPETGLALERVWPVLAHAALRERALGVILELAAPEQNRALARLFARAAQPADRALLVAHLAGDSSALEILRPASTHEEEVRIAAATALRALRGPEFVAFVDEWLGHERSERVRRLLGAAREALTTIPSYAPEKAIGPPDAVADQDHPNAWASARPDMGLQWLELGYAPARRASGLRIHEVCVPGALARVVAYDAHGSAHELWSGVDPTRMPGIFALDFPVTRFPVARVRLVLDTDRAPGWSEIDAVELVGPDGSAWASSAQASSWYGQR